MCDDLKGILVRPCSRWLRVASAWCLWTVLLVPRLGAQGPEALVATFSIVARDSVTGELGVAVQSKAFAVGNRVPWVEAGVGAIATQSFTDTRYGRDGLRLLREGLSPQAVLDRLLSEDEGRARRQVAIVDGRGRLGVFTGEGCFPWAGSYEGRDYSVQGNILVGPEVVEAMRRAFETTEGDLAARLLAALEAGQEVGGDVRGRQSAALVVAAPGDTLGSSPRYTIDLRVEDHHRPIAELRRLLTLHRALSHVGRVYRLVQAGQAEAALAEAHQAAELAPYNEEVTLALGLAHYAVGDLSAAQRAIQRALRMAPGLAVVVRHLPELGLLGGDQAFIESVLEGAGR